MKDSSIAIAGLSDDFVSQDDEGLIDFINTLRVCVREKVATEQRRGLSLSEIVDQVREIVRLAEEEALHSKSIPSHAFPAITRQAVAWCVEGYRPVASARKTAS